MSGFAVTVRLTDEDLVAIAARVAGLLAGEAAATAAPASPWLDVAGAAEYLRCPKSRVYALVSQRVLPHHRDGSRLLFRRDDLDAFVAAGGGRRRKAANGQGALGQTP